MQNDNLIPISTNEHVNALRHLFPEHDIEDLESIAMLCTILAPLVISEKIYNIDNQCFVSSKEADI
jgi:hypothetical protein